MQSGSTILIQIFYGSNSMMQNYFGTYNTFHALLGLLQKKWYYHFPLNNTNNILCIGHLRLVQHLNKERGSDLKNHQRSLFFASHEVF